MCRKYHIALFLILFSGSLFAQEEDYFYVDPDQRGQLDLGVRMGYGLNAVTGGMMRNPVPLFTFTGGVYHRYPLGKSKKVSLYHEISFSFKGSKFSESADSAIERIALVYFDLPVGLEFMLRESKTDGGGIIKQRLFLGVQPSILARSTLFRNLDDRIGREFALPLRTMDYALVVGIPVEFPVAYSKMGLSLYFKYGLRNINRDMERYAPLDNLTRNGTIRNWQLSFNITF